MDEVDNSNLPNSNIEETKDTKRPFQKGWVIFGFVLGIINGIVLFLECLNYGCIFTQVSLNDFVMLFSEITGKCCGHWVLVLVLIFVANLIRKRSKMEEIKYPSDKTIFYSILAFLSGITLFIILHILLELSLL